MNKPMKMKHVSILAVVAAGSIGVASAYAGQTEDPSQSAYATSGKTDPDLVRQVHNQPGSPRSKPDLYMAAHSLVPDYNLVREVRYQNGSPRRKPDLYLAAPAHVTDRDLIGEMRSQNGSPKSKK
jgi:hypothetical protein